MKSGSLFKFKCCEPRMSLAFGWPKAKISKFVFSAVKVCCQDISELWGRKPSVVPAVVKLKMMKMSKQNPRTYPLFWQSRVCNIKKLGFFLWLLDGRKGEKIKNINAVDRYISALQSWVRINKWRPKRNLLVLNAQVIDLSNPLSIGPQVCKENYCCMHAFFEVLAALNNISLSR